MVDDLEKLSERWIALRNTAKPSPNTVAARRRDLRVIAASIASVPADEALALLDTSHVVRRQLENAFAEYASTHAARSVQRVMSTWRQFCLWLVREELLDANPIDLIEGPRATAWQPKPLHASDLEDLARIVQMQDPTARRPWPERDTAMFALFITGGLRASELLNLTVGDSYLDNDPPRLRVTGKGNKDRTVMIPPETVVVLERYTTQRSERFGPPTPDQSLIVRSDGRQLTRSAVDHLVRGWFRRAGRTPPSGALAHSLRHTYATLLIDNGASLPEVQRLLGHANLNTTQAYIGVTGKGLEEAALSNPARRLIV